MPPKQWKSTCMDLSPATASMDCSHNWLRTIFHCRKQEATKSGICSGQRLAGFNVVSSRCTVWVFRTKAHSTRAISAEGCAGHNLATRTLACISHPRHARSPQRVAPDKTNWHSRLRFAPSRSPQRVARDRDKSHSRLHFAPSTRTISVEGCAGSRQIALSPAFRALDTRDLRRGLRRTKPTRTLACISRPRHARSPSTRTISAEGCSGPGQIALSPAFRAFDTHDLRRRLLRTGTNRTLACISRPRHAWSPQSVAPEKIKSHSRRHFAHPTRTISAEGWPRPGQIALSPAFRASDTHDLRRGLRFVAVRRRCPRP